MVITILEAEVAADRIEELERVFRHETGQLDPGIVETFLLRQPKGSCRILTVWRDREALEAMRASGETPRGIVMFRAVGAEPSLSRHDVLYHASGT